MVLRWNTYQGADVKGRAIDLLRLVDSQMNLPKLYVTNYIMKKGRKNESELPV